MLNVTLDTQRIIADLNALPEELRDKALKAGVLAVSTEGLSLLKQESPKKTGNLEQAMNRRQLSGSARQKLSIAGGTYAVVIGPNKRVGGIFRQRQANILEGGAREHEILPGKSNIKLDILYAQGIKRKANILYDRKTKKFFGKKVNHPGIAARLWMRSADDQLGSRTENLFYSGVQAYLDRRTRRA